MYKVSYMAYNDRLKIVVFRKEFATAEERKEHLDELCSCGCLYALLSWSDPYGKEEDALSCWINPEKSREKQ